MFLFVEIVNTRFRVALWQQRPALTFADQGLELAVFNFEVAENPRLGRAGYDASRFETLINPVAAKRALVVGALLEFYELDRLIRAKTVGAVTVFEHLAFDEMSIHVGTGHRAGPAPDTFVLVHQNDTVGTGVSRASRAGMLARRLIAVIAEHGQESPPGRRICADLAGNDASVMHAEWSAVLLLARQRAGVAADTALQVDHHAKSSHGFMLPLSAVEVTQNRHGHDLLATRQLFLQLFGVEALPIHNDGEIAA